MYLFETKSALQAYLKDFLERKATIGFVPTMGALHKGHLSLMQQSLEENALTVVSIFVNPTQFNNAEDLEKYPRNLASDLKKIEELHSEIVVFAPSVAEMYPSEISSERFDFQGIDKVMEGVSRPGHYDGVATIVKRLFEAVTPTRAYFGEKDYQQIQIIKKMVEQTQNPVIIVSCPIVREENGLAMSSRNERLSPQMKQRASFIYLSLINAKELFKTHSAAQIQQKMEALYHNHPDFTLEYFTLADADTLQTIVEKQENQSCRAFIVVYAEGVRLIDTLPM